MFTYGILYVLPILARFSLSYDMSPSRILLSLFPLIVVFPSTVLPHFIRDEEREHVMRHAIYAFAFTLSVGTSIRWETVSQAYPHEEWPLYLIMFCIVGTITLWWFVASHVLENRTSFCFTHQGDVTVLPLTLVAIATFVYDVPDEAFQFSRSILFYVPIVVAWATMHFVAFNSFAVSRTTTHTMRGFTFLAHSGLVVAITQLTLIELRSDPVGFLVLPLVASVLSQVTFRHTSPPALRPNRVFGMWCVQAGLNVGFGFLLRARFDNSRVILLVTIVGMAVVLITPVLCGNRWVFPGVLYSTLVTAVYMDVDDRISQTLRPMDIVVILAQFTIAFQVTHLIAPPVDVQVTPPVTTAPQSEHSTPQMDASPWSLTGILRGLNRIPIPHCRVHGEATVRHMMRTRTESCPAELAGVWWTKGTSFPMQLVTVHGHHWTMQGKTWSSTFSLRTGTRSATVGGLLNLWGQTPCYTHARYSPADPWIRTTGWVFPYLRWLPDTYWLYRKNENEMLRVVFDRNGKIIWQYKMLRIRTGDDRPTHFFRAFLQEYQDVPCILG